MYKKFIIIQTENQNALKLEIQLVGKIYVHYIHHFPNYKIQTLIRLYKKSHTIQRNIGML